MRRAPERPCNLAKQPLMMSSRLVVSRREHMLCEFRKLVMPGQRPPRGEMFDGYRELWEAVAPVILKRGQ